MNQLTFKFPFKTNYFEEDFYVSSNNFNAYKLIENCPNWPDKWINLYGPSGCGKTHLSNILKKKINCSYLVSEEFGDHLFSDIDHTECLILDNYKNNIDEKKMYSLLNLVKQSNKYIIINSLSPIKNFKIELTDLKSRLNSFIDLGIELPSDDLLRVIISKSFSDKQIDLNTRLLEYIIKNIERSYEKVFHFIKDVDNQSLSSGKPINIDLIKKILKNEKI